MKPVTPASMGDASTAQCALDGASYCGCIEDRQRRLGHIRWQLAETASAYPANAVIGSIRLGSLFLTLPTRWLTGQAVISPDGYGPSSAFK